MLQPLYPRETFPRIHWLGGDVDTGGGMDVSGRDEPILHAHILAPDLPVTILTALFLPPSRYPL